MERTEIFFIHRCNNYFRKVGTGRTFSWQGTARAIRWTIRFSTKHPGVINATPREYIFLIR